MKKHFGLRIIKSGLAIVMAIYIASFLQLEYAASAGIIAILSILDTKKETLFIAGKRLLSSIIGLVMASVLFILFGFEIFVIGIFLVLFLPLANLFKLESGFIINIVLVTHLLDFGAINFSHLLNEIALVTIGIAVGLLFNIHIPSLEKELKRKQAEIEKDLKVTLKRYALNLKNACLLDEDENDLHEKLYQNIKHGIKLAYRHSDNHYFKTNPYYIKYMEMRKRQFQILEAMQLSLKKTPLSRSFSDQISDLTLQLSLEISTENDGQLALKKLEKIQSYYESLPLPDTREIFEHRAHLLIFLNHLQHFIEVKKKFSEENRPYSSNE